ncbi:hypothetical protein SLS58_008745 [Diplodia intermedia]|uniref:Uncharacterized protein n=1 Tax=Diplodia intermedia TaxID=856260 RepID=A0ABR3TGM6_9PEZI
MNPPRLDVQACRAYLYACANSLLANIATADLPTLAAIPDTAKLEQFTRDIVGLSESQIRPGMTQRVHNNEEFHPASIRMYVKNVLHQSADHLHRPATPENKRIVEFIWKECLSYIQAEDTAEEEQRRKQQAEQEAYDRQHAEEFRLNEVKRTWRSVELNFLAHLFADNPDLEFAAAARMVNRHYRGQMVDGVAFTERTADAVSYQVSHKNIMAVAKRIREKRQGLDDKVAGEGEAASPNLRSA